jgi:hypothetical protein
VILQYTPADPGPLGDTVSVGGVKALVVNTFNSGLDNLGAGDITFAGFGCSHKLGSLKSGDIVPAKKIVATIKNSRYFLGHTL